ncbi:MAG: hypothetical protein H6722_18245 [Sandaracinus sp.]|nr:hypothetical protein [Sandaracinus sp.]
MVRVVALLVGLAIVPPIVAQDARTSLAEARDAEARFEFSAAVEAYRRVVASEPTSRLAHVARRRLTWLEERSEGDFAPLAVLERARATLPDLDRLEADAFAMPEGRVRRETLELVARERAGKGDAIGAERVARRWLETPDITPDERRRAVAFLARTVAEEAPDEARAILRDAQMEDAAVAEELAWRAGIETGRTWAFVTLVLAALLVLACAGGAWASPSRLRALARPGVLLTLLWLTALPLGIAYLYDRSTLDTFARLALAIGGIFVVARLIADVLHDAPPWRRRGAALGVLMAHVSVGYLVLVASGATLGVLGP